MTAMRAAAGMEACLEDMEAMRENETGGGDGRPLRRRRFGKKRLYWCAAILAVSGALFLGVAWYAHATVMAAGEGRIYRLEEAPAAEVALVFGAHVSEKGDVSWPLEWRLKAAGELYGKGLVKRILVSGDNRRLDYNEPLAMKQWLVDNGVPEDRVACDYAGRRTLDSCARAARLWGLRDRVILVSQAYHLPRALFLAESWGMDAVAVAAGSGTFRRDLTRERLARVKAWLDVRVLGVGPTVWGPPERWPDGATAGRDGGAGDANDFSMEWKDGGSEGK